ncbi:MAG TPA: GDP-mannose 4,6-dehydratase, partial [Bacteroidia bacterium]|nr:GDP-mannose 4,6-dehydratase [Bacteroidia bacterium]
MERLLITGAAGFIGSNLSEFFLNAGYHVTGLDNFDSFYDRKIKENNITRSLLHPNFLFHETDITDREQLKKLPAKMDVVIHIAAKAGVLPSIKDPMAYINNNITGTQNLLEWMKENEIKKMLFASSSSIYGNNVKVPFAESDVVDNPISPYAFTKKSCELLNHTYHHLYGFDILNLRFFTVYGPRQRPDLAIHKFVKLISEKQPVTMYGDGSSARDYTYITDIIRGINGALDYLKNKTGVYDIINLGNHRPVKLSELVFAIYELTGATPDIKYLPMQPGDVDTTFADISKAKKMFGYSPETKLKDGLMNFINWYR